MSRPVIHWFRRDLRLHDNTALHHAILNGAPVLPVFVFDDKLLRSDRIGAPRLHFLLHTLHDLDHNLRTHGARLIIRRGDPLDILPELIAQTDAQALYFNADYSPYARRRDEELKSALDIPVHSHHDALLIPPPNILKADDTPYTVFTPFKKRWNEYEKPAQYETPLTNTAFYTAIDLTSHDFPSPTEFGYAQASPIPLPPATYAHAHHLLNEFLQADITTYDATRNDLPINPYAEQRPSGTSYLSPYLRLGILSPRACYWSARQAYADASDPQARESVATWVSELTWREFYTHILYHFPHVLERDFVDTYADLQWRDDPHHLQAWQNGETGYPIVDAPMRQLRAIGWMPNRARMIVSSFLTKHLLIHWRAGDIFFMKHLIDGDPAANNGGWQWASGTGTDAQPYFRIFNPILQSQKFATPEYLRHWLPELANTPEKHIHTPWMMPKPPAHYPAPIVEHKIARQQAIDAFKRARQTD